MWHGVFIFVLFAIGLTYLWLRYLFSYWSRHHVPQIPPTLIVGNLGKLLRMQKSTAEFIQDLYNHESIADRAFTGIYLFHKPAIFVRDPELIRRVLIKDFSKFNNRYSNSDYKGDPIGSMNLFFLKNPAWKEVRLHLTPFFTSGKLKHMFHLVEEVGQSLDRYLLNQTLKSHIEKSFCLELKELCALYTTDVIASVAYGVQANSFRNPNGDFRRYGRCVFKFGLKRAFEFMIIFFLPHLVPYLRLYVVPPESSSFLRATINYVMQQRELSGQKRNDLIDILIEFKNSSNLKPNNSQLPPFEGDLLVAQAALFFTAGFETSSATMSFALYELAKAPDLQQRLRYEIKQKLIEYDGNVTQQLIESLDLMQMTINEVLRLYPPLPFLDRECTADDKSGGYSMAPFHKFRVPKGMPIIVPVYGVHMDPKYYPNPKCFEPQRFSPANKKKLPPYAYMPFGLGPHACIGERFAMIQTKIGLLYFLRNHYVAASPRTKIPIKLDSKALIIQAEGGIYLNVIRDPLGV